MANTDLDINAMREAAVHATGLLRVLANEDRLLLLCQLTRAEACVSDLEALLGIRQPTLSQQLSVLRAEELVSTRREGKKIFYRVCDARAVCVLETLYGIYCPGPGASDRSPPGGAEQP